MQRLRSVLMHPICPAKIGLDLCTMIMSSWCNCNEFAFFCIAESSMMYQEPILQFTAFKSFNSQPSKRPSNSGTFRLRSSISPLFFAGEKAQYFLTPCSHMPSEVNFEPDTALTSVQPWLFSDSVTALLSRAFTAAKLPEYCSYYGYGQVTNSPVCSVTFHRKMLKYHFSFRSHTCRLKEPQMIQWFQPYRKHNTSSPFYNTWSRRKIYFFLS